MELTSATTTTCASSGALPAEAAAAAASAVPPPPALRSSISIGSSRALAALSALALQAKGLTSVLQRPKFLANEPRAPSFQSKPEAAKTLSSSSLSSSAVTEEALEDIEPRESVDETPATTLSRRSRLDSADSATTTAQLLPWELCDEHGCVTEHTVVRDKVLELAVYRRTFVEDAGGEDEFLFQYARYKDVVRRLLLRDPNLREKYAAIVHSPTFVVSEETFWRNFFLRCNAIRVAAGVPPYLPPVVLSSVAAVASFQRFKRDMFLKKQRSSAELERLRHSLLQLRRAPDGGALSIDESDPMSQDWELGELELDLDGEIERELVRRRPSRASEYCRSMVAGPRESESASETQP